MKRKRQYLIFEGKFKGGNKHIYFQMIAGHWIDKVRLLANIDFKLHSLDARLNLKLTEQTRGCTGNKEATACSRRFCWPYFPLRR